MTLVHQFDPSFEIQTKKLDEEIPNFFKGIGYPFPISKNSLLAIGAPSSWPGLLGALLWLT